VCVCVCVCSVYNRSGHGRQSRRKIIISDIIYGRYVPRRRLPARFCLRRRLRKCVPPSPPTPVREHNTHRPRTYNGGHSPSKRITSWNGGGGGGGGGALDRKRGYNYFGTVYSRRSVNTCTRINMAANRLRSYLLL